MKTGRGFHLVFVVFVLVVVLACSTIFPTSDGGNTASPGTSPTESTQSTKPIVGTWRQLDIPGLTEGDATYLVNYAQLGENYYFSTATSGTGASETLTQPASIWRTRDGLAWEMAGEPGMGNPQNRSLTVYVWHERVYVAAGDGRLFSLWASDDGQTFRQIQGDWPAEGTASMHAIADKLFLFIGNNLGAGLQAWSSGDGKRFEIVFDGGLGDAANTNTLSTHGLELTSLDGWTYLGILNQTKGGEVWRTRDGGAWERSLTGGAGDTANAGFMPQLVFNGFLYASVPPFNPSNAQGVNVFRTADGRQWEQVVENGFEVGQHQATWGWMTAFHDTLYLATPNDDPRGVSYSPSGFRLWKSLDGKSWEQVGEPGLGNPNNFMLTMNTIRDVFYLGPYNFKDGNQLWQSTNGENWQLVHTAPASPTNQGGGVFEVADSLIFNTNDPEQGISIWRYGP